MGRTRSIGKTLDDLRSLCRNWRYVCVRCGHVTWACWPLTMHDRCFVKAQDGSVCGGSITCEVVAA